MSDSAGKPADGSEAPVKKRSKMPLLIGLVLMLGLGGGGFFAVRTGMLLGSGADHAAEDAAGNEVEPLPDIAFVALDPLIVSLGGSGTSTARHLRLTAQLEVPSAYEAEVRLLIPRVLDVMNSYLRAVDVGLLDDPTALTRLRAQIMRRVQLVAGEGRVRDVLLTEFVIN
jgi:flagellar protein FliL